MLLDAHCLAPSSFIWFTRRSRLVPPALASLESPLSPLLAALLTSVFVHTSPSAGNACSHFSLRVCQENSSPSGKFQGKWEGSMKPSVLCLSFSYSLSTRGVSSKLPQAPVDSNPGSATRCYSSPLVLSPMPQSRL